MRQEESQMSHAFDSQGNKYDLEEVQRYCLTQLDLFTRRSAFGWPMDRILDQPYGIERDWGM